VIITIHCNIFDFRRLIRRRKKTILWTKTKKDTKIKKIETNTALIIVKIIDLIKYTVPINACGAQLISTSNLHYIDAMMVAQSNVLPWQQQRPAERCYVVLPLLTSWSFNCILIQNIVIYHHTYHW